MQDRLLHEAARLQAHPAFPQAVNTYCAALARLREAPRLVNAIIATDVRWRIMGYLLYLAADTERFGPQGGATYARLLELCSMRQEAGARALKTMLGLLKLAFMVRTVPDESDARIRHYVPTERLNHFVRDWMGYAVAALDLLEPGMARSRFLDDPAFIARFNVSGGRAHLADAVPLADRMPAPLSAVQSMLGGFSVLAGVIEAELAGTPPPSASRLAWRFGLSRSQVVNVLAAGQEAGLFAQGGDGRARTTPALRESFHRWIAIELAFYARHMRPPDEALQPVQDNLV